MADGLGFARKQLEKHGWVEGKGLGKEESGISKAIKVNIKTDSAGVGYDAGDQFSFHWWDHVFNKTAKSFVVQESEEGVEVVKSSKETCSVSSKRPNKNVNKPMLYGRFVKASSQTQENKTQESDDDSDSDKDFSHLCPDEKLFQACGGRTAHKAARHGLLLNGKLQRVQKQEKLGNSVHRYNTVTAEGSDPDHKCSLIVEKQQYKEQKRKRKEAKNEKRKKKRKYREICQEDSHELYELSNCRDDLNRIRKEKKEIMIIERNDVDGHKLEKHNSFDDYEKIQKGKKKRRSRDLQAVKDYKPEEELNCWEDNKKHREKKIKNLVIQIQDGGKYKKKIKKRKHNDQPRENNYKVEDLYTACVDHANEKRVKKKKKKQR